MWELLLEFAEKTFHFDSFPTLCSDLALVSCPISSLESRVSTAWQLGTPLFDYILIREILDLFEVQLLASWIHTIVVIPLSMTNKIKFVWLIFLGVLLWTYRYFSFPWIPPWHLWISVIYSSHSHCLFLKISHEASGTQFVPISRALLLLFPVCNILFPLSQHYPSFIFKLDPKSLGSHCFYSSAWSLVITYISFTLC